jgi:hypothetical protein
MDPRDPDSPVAGDDEAEDQARGETTVAELVDQDRRDPSTAEHFEVPLEPLDDAG